MNPFPGRRRTILAARTNVKNHGAVGDVVNDDTVAFKDALNTADVVDVPQLPMSFKGLKACPKCRKEMNRGIAMHYRHCKG